MTAGQLIASTSYQIRLSQTITDYFSLSKGRVNAAVAGSILRV
jgi:hypothetical protein